MPDRMLIRSAEIETSTHRAGRLTYVFSQAGRLTYILSQAGRLTYILSQAGRLTYSSFRSILKTRSKSASVTCLTGYKTDACIL